MKETYQLKIELKHIKPLIWRRVLVDAEMNLKDLHCIIQTSMGWTNSHLHQFIVGNEIYSANEDVEEFEAKDASKIILKDVLKSEKDSMLYEYDFGDGWLHKIILEKILQNKTDDLPKCIAGKRNCPPEDCGGFPGYENMLKILSNPKHKEYEEQIEWLGGGYDPEEFDIEAVNEMLKDEDYGTFWWN